MSEDITPYNSNNEDINDSITDDNKSKVDTLLEAVDLSNNSVREILYIIDLTLNGNITHDQRHDIRNHLQYITSTNELLSLMLPKLQ